MTFVGKGQMSIEDKMTRIHAKQFFSLVGKEMNEDEEGIDISLDCFAYLMSNIGSGNIVSGSNIEYMLETWKEAKDLLDRLEAKYVLVILEGNAALFNPELLVYDMTRDQRKEAREKFKQACLRKR